MFGININPLLPVRTQPSEQAEMSTQLLFGEFFSISEQRDKWSFIQNYKDGYTGWVDRKMITSIIEDEFTALQQHKPIQVYTPVATCDIVNRKSSMLLPAGSLLHYYSFESGMAHFMGNEYKVAAESLSKRGEKPASGNLIVSIARSFINAPYLWGGKSVLGIDCSGLVQVTFGLCGIQLPRDAGQQVNTGTVIPHLKLAQTGDLAFFENEQGKITHVGILMDSENIIHASGRVKIEEIDEKGIRSEIDSCYTHKLSYIKRVC